MGSHGKKTLKMVGICLFVLCRGLVCLRHTGGATAGCGPSKDPRRRGLHTLPSRCEPGHPTHHSRGTIGLQTPRKPHFMWFSAGEMGDLSLDLPSHPRVNEAGSSRPTGQGLTQLGLAWETSSCWLEGLTLRIETSVLMPRAWGLTPASPWTITNNNQ